VLTSVIKEIPLNGENKLASFKEPPEPKKNNYPEDPVHVELEILSGNFEF